MYGAPPSGRQPGWSPFPPPPPSGWPSAPLSSAPLQTQPTPRSMTAWNAPQFYAARPSSAAASHFPGASRSSPFEQSPAVALSSGGRGGAVGGAAWPPASSPSPYHQSTAFPSGSMSARDASAAPTFSSFRPPSSSSFSPHPPSSAVPLPSGPSVFVPQPPPSSDATQPFAGSLSARAAYASVSAANGFTHITQPILPPALAFVQQHNPASLPSPYAPAPPPPAASDSALPPSLLLHPPPRANFHRTGDRSYMSRSLDPLGLFHPTDGPLGSRRIHAFQATVDMHRMEGRDGWIPAKGAHPEAIKYNAHTHAKRVAAQQQRAQSARIHCHGVDHAASDSPLPAPQSPSLSAARADVLAYFASPTCLLFSQSASIVAVSDADLDRLIRVCQASTDHPALQGAGKEAQHTLALLTDLDIEQMRFSSFEALLDEAKQRSMQGVNGSAIDNNGRPITPTFLTEQDAADNATPGRASAKQKLSSSPYNYSGRPGTSSSDADAPRSLALVSPRAIARSRARLASAREAWFERRERAEARASRQRQKVVEERAAARAEKQAQEEAAAAEEARAKAEKMRKAAVDARKAREDETERQLADRAARLKREEAEKAAALAEMNKKEEAYRRRDAEAKRLIAEQKDALKQAKRKAKQERMAKFIAQGENAGNVLTAASTAPPGSSSAVAGAAVPAVPPPREGPPAHHFSDAARPSKQNGDTVDRTSPVAPDAPVEADAAAAPPPPLAEVTLTFQLIKNGDEEEYVEVGAQATTVTPAQQQTERAAATDDDAKQVEAQPKENIDASKPLPSVAPAAVAASSPSSLSSSPAPAARTSTAKCDQCYSAVATLLCAQCDEKQCDACDTEVHQSDSMARHVRTPLVSDDDGNAAKDDSDGATASTNLNAVAAASDVGAPLDDASNRATSDAHVPSSESAVAAVAPSAAEVEATPLPSTAADSVDAAGSLPADPPAVFSSSASAAPAASSLPAAASAPSSLPSAVEDASVPSSAAVPLSSPSHSLDACPSATPTATTHAASSRPPSAPRQRRASHSQRRSSKPLQSHSTSQLTAAAVAPPADLPVDPPPLPAVGAASVAVVVPSSGRPASHAASRKNSASIGELGKLDDDLEDF